MKKNIIPIIILFQLMLSTTNGNLAVFGHYSIVEKSGEKHLNVNVYARNMGTQTIGVCTSNSDSDIEIKADAKGTISLECKFSMDKLFFKGEVIQVIPPEDSLSIVKLSRGEVCKLFIITQVKVPDTLEIQEVLATYKVEEELARRFYCRSIEQTVRLEKFKDFVKR